LLPYSRLNVGINDWSTLFFHKVAGLFRGGYLRGMFSGRRIVLVCRHDSRRSPARLVAVALLAASLGACSSGMNLFSRNETVPDDPPEKLYNEGVYMLNQRRDYKDAAKKFEEVERQHPYSDWARKSLIMTAYARYEAKEYEESVTAAKRYVTLHPGSADAAYAQFLIGSAYFEQIPDVTRDQTRAERAIAALDEVARKYPDSEYAVSAKNKIDIARDQIAGKEMAIGRYYQNKKDFTGAINRFKLVVTQYQRTRHVEEALARLTECYMALGIVGEAQTAAAVLGHNFPESRWYADAYKLVKSGGVSPSANPGSWITRAFRMPGSPTVSPPPASASAGPAPTASGGAGFMNNLFGRSATPASSTPASSPPPAVAPAPAPEAPPPEAAPPPPPPTSSTGSSLMSRLFGRPAAPASASSADASAASDAKPDQHGSSVQ
jgi:outer membrane protein assembly factor BamD